METKITKQFLESILIKDKEISNIIRKVETEIDKELLKNTQLYSKIEAYIPLNISFFNETFNTTPKLTDSNKMRVWEEIVECYKNKGFNVFLVNTSSAAEVGYIITNQNNIKNNVSEVMETNNQTPIFKNAIKK